MTLEELEDDLKKLTSEIRSKQDEAKDIKQSIANIKCPFVVGELVIDKHGCKAIVDRIIYSYSGYDLKIKKIKKNGEPYKDSNHTYFCDKWEKLNPPGE